MTASRRGRSLRSYLLLPRPKDLGKAWILPAAFTVVRKHMDIASWFAAGGGLLIVAAVALSLWWNRTQRRRAPRASPVDGAG